MKKFLSLGFLSLLALTMSFSTAFAATTGTGTASVQVTGGDLALTSYPSTLAFTGYSIGLANADLNLTNAFDIQIDDFRGSLAGWSIQLSVDELVNGATPLDSAALTSEFDSVAFHQSTQAGTVGALVPTAGSPFSYTDGAIPFGPAKSIVSAAADNIVTAGRTHILFPANSMTLAFSNKSQVGNYSGATTFNVLLSP